MIARALYGACFVFVVLLMLAYAGAVLPVLPWWSWPIAVAGVVVLRRWHRLRRAGLLGQPDPDGPKWNPVGGGGR